MNVKFVEQSFPYMKYALISDGGVSRRREIDGNTEFPTLYLGESDLMVDPDMYRAALIHIRELGRSHHTPEWAHSRSSLMHLMTSRGKFSLSPSIWVPDNEFARMILDGDSSMIDTAFLYQSWLLRTPYMRLDHVKSYLRESVPLEWSTSFIQSQDYELTVSEAARGGLIDQMLFMCYNLELVKHLALMVCDWKHSDSLELFLSMLKDQTSFSDEDRVKLEDQSRKDNTFQFILDIISEITASPEYDQFKKSSSGRGTEILETS